MISIRGVYEVVIRVRDLARAEKFYCEQLGLSVGLRVEERGMLFLRAGGQAGMVVLQHDPGAWPTQHFAFTVEDDEIEEAGRALERQGIETHGPVVHDWMPARSVYFADPDGHALELCAPLPPTGSA